MSSLCCCFMHHAKPKPLSICHVINFRAKCDKTKAFVDIKSPCKFPLCQVNHIQCLFKICLLGQRSNKRYNCQVLLPRQILCKGSLCSDFVVTLLSKQIPPPP